MKLSRIESGLRLALAFYEAFNNHDAAAMADMISDDCLLETFAPSPAGRLISGRETIAHYWQESFAKTADLHLELEDIFGLGQRVIALYRCDWTDAASAAQHIRGVDIMRFQSNMITEIKAYSKG